MRQKSQPKLLTKSINLISQQSQPRLHQKTLNEIYLKPQLKTLKQMTQKTLVKK